jgi:broad specificity phosphatase PhoE
MIVTRTIILCRHGEIDNPQNVLYGRSIDVPLNHTGRKQIESIATQIKALNIEWDSIISSTLLRAVQSAEILARHVNVSIKPHPQLVDVHIPALVGQPIRIRKELHEKGEDEYSGEWIQKGNESRKEIISRMVDAFEEIQTQHKGNLLIISHGDPLAFLLYVLEHPNGKVLPICTILKRGYGLKKGSGIILKFNEAGKIIKKTLLAPTVD